MSCIRNRIGNRNLERNRKSIYERRRLPREVRDPLCVEVRTCSRIEQLEDNCSRRHVYLFLLYSKQARVKIAYSILLDTTDEIS